MGTRWSSTRTNTGAEIDNGATRTGACSHCSFGANFHGATSEKAVYLSAALTGNSRATSRRSPQRVSFETSGTELEESGVDQPAKKRSSVRNGRGCSQ